MEYQGEESEKTRGDVMCSVFKKELNESSSELYELFMKTQPVVNRKRFELKSVSEIIK